MKKLEDIPKKQIFNVPEGYFEELPGIIQSRVATTQAKKLSPAYSYALKYSMAMVAILVAALLWFRRDAAIQSPESMLATIETTDLVSYLNDDDMSTEELLDGVALHAEDADFIEDAVYGIGLENDNFEEIFDELD